MRAVRNVFVFLACFFTFVALPISAYALTNTYYDGLLYKGVIVRTIPDVTAPLWYIVDAPDVYSAAAYALGQNPYDLTVEQRALLSNSSTGGDFYEFAQQFGDYGGSFDLPDWMGPSEQKVFIQYSNAYSEKDLYVGMSSSVLWASALAHYKTVLNGNVAGGGSGVYYDLSFDVYYAPNSSDYRKYNINNTSYYYNDDVNLTPKLGSPVTVRLTASFYDRITSHANYIIGLYSNSSSPALYILFADDTDLKSFPNVAWSSDNPNVVLDVGYKFFHFTKSSTSNYINCFEYILPLSVANGYSNDAPVFYSDVEDASFTRLTASGWSNNPVISLFDGSVAPSLPNNWPESEPDSAPQSPDVPNPITPEPISQPDSPTPQPDTTYNTFVNLGGDTYTADLQGILDAMDEHCIHLQDAIWWNFKEFWQKLSGKLTNDFATLRTYLSEQFGWIVDSVGDEFESLQDYLKELAEWLADELDYSISGSAYDDNTLLSWLRRIYYKLGNGGVSTKPVDPNADPEGVGDWISQLLANLFTALDDLAGGLLTTLAGLVSGLVSKFPFSIPWDIAAILGLLVANPVAPAFDVPIYVLGDGGLVQVGVYEIDLDVFTPYLGGIQMMVKIGFILYLLTKTKDFMALMERVVGLA